MEVWVFDTDLLEEVGDALALRTREAAGLEKLQDVFAGSVVDDVAFGEEYHVVEQVESLGVWL